MTTLHHSDTQPEPDTRAQIRRAADELTAAGLRVSVRSVRNRIGRGSTTTISEELRNWRSADLALRERPSRAGPALDVTLPPGLAQEAQVLYLRVLAQVGLLFSDRRANDALQSADVCAQQLATLDQVARLSDFGSGVATQLVASVEERARLTSELLARDATVEQLAERLTVATGEITRLSQELVVAKLAAAEREALALTRVEGLSKHLMRMTEEQRAQLAAPLATLRERYESLQTRENILVQQVNGLREQVAALQGRLQARDA